MAKQSFQQLINGSKPVLVDFYADWCGPCKAQKPILEEFSRKAGDKVAIIQVDVDRNQNAAAKYQVRSIPTMMLFKNGQVVWQHSGVVSGQELEKVIAPHTA